jgi:hypothetical protein
MVVKSWLVAAKVCTIHKTKDVLGCFVATTLLRMAISFPCKRMEPNFLLILAKDFIIQGMKVEVG